MTLMSTTPGKPRVSGIPTPGKASGIPTPGRLRSSSSAGSANGGLANADPDVTFLSRTLADAIKANDPAHHRPGRLSDVSGASFPQLTSFVSASASRSVTGRPSSAASSTSVVNSTVPKAPQSRAKPLPVRPPSRQSDVFTRSVSRTGRPLEVGDDVRIESLGFEGVLRYLGEIDGKVGTWAGVELSGGFAGKGKNNGSVNGIQYFSCPPNCGVFVASGKLSPPAVRIGIMSRPSSVASSRSGRTTPSISGRMTPSVSTGRVTPSISAGRITPSLSSSRVTPSLPSGRTTPATRARNTGHPRFVMTTPKTTAVVTENKITPGSRASKYVGVTANQLNAREHAAAPLSRKSLGSESPTRKAFASAPSMSPARTIGSPFNTPKVGPNVQPSDGLSPSPSKGRMSFKTPRPRIPSSMAMPPPSSPSMALSSLTTSSSDDLPETRHQTLRTASISGSPRPGSTSSSRSTPVHELLDDVSRLQSRLDALEFENQQLREAQSHPHPVQVDNSAELTSLRTERDDLQSRINTLETTLKLHERSIDERDTKIQTLERSIKDTALDISKLKTDSESRMRDLQAKLDDSEALNKNLKEVLEAKEGQEDANDAVLAAKGAEISVLEGRVEKVYKELEEERRELNAQVDELRKAGQETIALYEERLSASEARRYETEDLIASLEEQVRSSARPPSPNSLAVYASSAAQIDNETLKDQVQHLQKKITSLEDMLEDARTAAERDEAVVRERIKRYKDKEEALKKDVNDCKKEIERLVQSEEHAKQRLMESEEAFRENAVTLENARAEIEVLRSELANIEEVSTGSTSTGLPRKASDLVSKVTTERTKLVDELASLKARLDESVAEKGGLSQMLESVREQMDGLTRSHQAELDQEQQTSTTLRQELEERVFELDSLRKKVNREITVTSFQDSGKQSSASSTPARPESSASREEITGLKHIVQELQKENQVVAQQNKLLESENKLLLTETEQLRQELQVLEDNVEQSLLREEASMPSGTQGYPENLQHVLQELKAKHENEIEQLRKRLADVEMKSARTIHDLHKEISELESLIESKIYREDDLEREVERLKEKLARTQKKTSRNGIEPNGVLQTASAEDVCEICEQPGHDIFSCSLLKDEPAVSISSRGEGDELFCEDCESRGHVAVDCPHSLDVF